MGQRHQATGCQSSADGIITGVALPHELAEAECAGVGALLAACEVEVGVVVADVALVLLPSSGSGLLLLQLLPSSSCSGGLLLLLLLLLLVVLLPSTTSSSYGQSTCGNQFISWFSKTSVHQFDRHRQTDQRGKQEYSSSSS
jgi:hypothetical protein